MARIGCVSLAVAIWAAACGGPKPNVYRVAYPDGTLRWKVERIGTLPHGDSETRHPNGKLAARGHYRRGLKDGLFVYYDKQGEPIRQAVYEAGDLVWESEDMDAVSPVPVRERAAVDEVAQISPFPPTYPWIAAGIGAGSSIPIYVAGMEEETRPDARFVLGFTAGVWLRNAVIYGAYDLAEAELQSQLFAGVGAGYAPLSRSSPWVVQVAAEGGGHRIGGIGAAPGRPLPRDHVAWLPYFGLRGSVAVRVWSGIAAGVEAYGRQDVDTLGRWPDGYGGLRWEVGGRVGGALLVLRWVPRPGEEKR